MRNSYMSYVKNLIILLNDRHENLTTTINKTTNNESDLITLCKRIVEWEERTLSRLDILENILSKII